MVSTQREKLVDSVSAILRAQEYQHLRQLYEKIITERIQQAATPDCLILSLLTGNVHHVLKEWERRCEAYSKAVLSKDDAVAKAETELLGPARKCSPGQFNAVLGDFFAEMCAVGALSKLEYSDFEPITPARTKTPDYGCRINSQPACLEFKNIRAPRTVVDTIREMLPNYKLSNPALQKKRIVLTYYWDNTVTDEQREEIDTFMTTLDTSVPTHDLYLTGGVHVRVGLIVGDGSLMMTRGIRIGDSIFVDEDKLMTKIESIVERAIAQLRLYDCERKVLAVNVMTADMMMPEAWGDAIREIVQDRSSGDVCCEVLFAYDSVLR